MKGRGVAPGFLEPGDGVHWGGATRGNRRRASCVAAIALLIARDAWAQDPPEVEVRGEPIATPPKDPSVAGSVIPADRLQAPGLQASDALRTQPGVAVVETGGFGSLSTASIRGATAAQTPAYLAGVRLNDDVGGVADLSLVPLWMLRRVEIYRSNAPLAGDQLGIGGAIFFEPRRPRSAEAGAGVLAGSFGAHALWARAGLGDDRASGLVGIRVDGARNDYPFVNDSGARFEQGQSHTVLLANADERTLDVWALGSAHLGREGRADLVFHEVDRDAGMPGLPLYPTTRSRVHTHRELAGLTAAVPCAVRCVVTTTTSAVVSSARYDDPLLESALGTTRVELDATRVEEALFVRWSPSSRFAITPAVHAALERLTIDAASVPAIRAERVFSRGALQAEWAPLEPVTLRALGSAECNGTSHAGALPWSLPGGVAGPRESGTCGNLQPSARLGVEVGRAPLALLANVGRYAREPTLGELFGISGAARGNGALSPETGVSLDLGVRATAPPESLLRGASVDLFGFVRSASDLIAYERSTWGYAVPYNVGSARVAGVELLADYRPARLVSFDLAATVIDARNTSPVRPVNDVLPYQPALTLVPRVELGGPIAAGPIAGGKLAVTYFYESSRYFDPAGLVVIPAQGSLDVDAEVGVLHGRVVVRGRLVNVLDQTRFDLIGYPLPGRAAYATLEATWE